MPNTNYDAVLTTTIESRSKTIQDNVTAHNAGYYKMAERGNVRPFNGGHKILEPLSYAENTNTGWYSGADVLTTGVTDELTAPEFSIKQLAAPVVITGLDEIKNSGPSGLIDLIEAKVRVAESTMENKMDVGFYADGTGSDGKELTGLGAAVPITVTNNYGNIDRNLAVNTWWKSYVSDSNAVPSSTTILGIYNTAWLNLTRNADAPDLLIAASDAYAAYEAALQPLQQFTNQKMAQAGFTALKYKMADYVYGGANVTIGTTFFLNTKYIHLRPFSGRNMVPLAPDSQRPYNQDVTAKVIAWAGNLTCSGAKFQGRVIMS